jgi:hypothetical protein
LALTALILVSGCAKSPDGGAGLGTRLLIKMKLDGQPNPSLVYIIAFNPTTEANPSGKGPLPVVAPPWGNGFVAGRAKYYVRWDPAQRQPYVLYRFLDSNLNTWTDVGVPILYEVPTATTKELRFTLDLKQLAGSEAEAALLQTLQVNFLTMDRVPQGNDSGDKNFDALGNTRSAAEIDSYINIPLNVSRVYDNRFFNQLEPINDVAAPELDISNFSVEVRLP